ncbi:hypothetical protein Q5752_003487 [Cryptotrichosporon argae]
MSSQLPPNLLRLFAPRPPLPYLEPLTKDERVRGPDKLTGITALVQRLRSEAEDDEYRQGMGAEAGDPAGRDVKMEDAIGASEAKANGAAAAKTEDTAKAKAKGNGKGKERKDEVSAKGVIGQEAVKMRRELRKKRQEQYKKDVEKNWDPNHDPEISGDPYKTLFISKLSSKTTEADLMREFEVYGNIERIRIVRDRKKKSKAYAFVVYERERDMKAAYKDADGIPIHHKRIMVDVERGRTVKDWKPRKLGGGLGGRPKKVEPTADAGFAPGFGMRGGFGGRGGFRGGFRGGPPGGGFRGGPGGGGFGSRGGFGGRGGSFGGGGGGYSGGGGGFGGGRGGYGGGGNPNLAGPGGGQTSMGAPGSGYGGQGGGYGGAPGGGGGGYGGPPGGGGYGAPGGYKRDFDGGAAGGGGGGFYDDRDAKRPRY